jgi:glutamate racemase
MVRPLLQRILGPEVVLVSSGEPLARTVEHVLGSRALASSREGEGSYRFLTTGDPGPFAAMGTRFLQMPLGPVDRVELAPLEGSFAA